MLQYNILILYIQYMYNLYYISFIFSKLNKITLKLFSFDCD